MDFTVFIAKIFQILKIIKRNFHFLDNITFSQQCYFDYVLKYYELKLETLSIK